MRARAFLAIALLPIALALAGCGGGGGGGGAESDEPQHWVLPGSGTAVLENDTAIHDWGAWLGPCIYKVSQAALDTGNTAFTPLDATKYCAVESCVYSTTDRRQFERARASGGELGPPLLKNEEISWDSEVCYEDHLYIAKFIVPAVFAKENP